MLPFYAFAKTARLPRQAKEGDAGYDLFPLQRTKIQPGEVVKIRTGVGVAIPFGYVGLCRDRSGMAWKEEKGIILRNGIHVLGGVIDRNYRGEINVILVNLGILGVSLEPEIAIAQMVVVPYFQDSSEFVSAADWDELSRGSERGIQGFGSSDNPCVEIANEYRRFQHAETVDDDLYLLRLLDSLTPTKLEEFREEFLKLRGKLKLDYILFLERGGDRISPLDWIAKGPKTLDR